MRKRKNTVPKIVERERISDYVLQLANERMDLPFDFEERDRIFPELNSSDINEILLDVAEKFKITVIDFDNNYHECHNFGEFIDCIFNSQIL